MAVKMLYLCTRVIHANVWKYERVIGVDDSRGNMDQLVTQEFLEMMILDESTINSTRGWTKPDCQCLQGCNDLSYSSSMTYGNIDPSFVKSMRYVEETNLDKTYVRKNLAVVHLYFTHTQFLSYYKTEIFGLSEFLSSTGGLLGLFIGFSFISAVEILYFGTVRLWHSIAGRRNTIVENYPFVK